MDEESKKLLSKCWGKVHNTYGFIYIFTERATKYGKINKALKFSGIVIPVTVGLTAMGYGVDSEILKKVVWLAAGFTLAQFILSLTAIVYDYDSELSYAYEASADYSNLYSEFNDLANFPPKDFSELKRRYDLIEAKLNARDRQDGKHSIQEKELRKGMRRTLREHQIECVECKIKPTSMKSSNCNVCGKF